MTFEVKQTDSNTTIYCQTHNHYIPLDPKNRHYQEVLDSINTDGADAWDDTVATYDDIPEDLRTAAESKKFNQQLADYKVAKARLEQYEVATGQTAETRQVVEGREYDEATDRFVDVYITEEVKVAIDPVDATVEQREWDFDNEEYVTTTIENPLITKDKEERAAAQAVVDATPQAVIDAA